MRALAALLFCLFAFPAAAALEALDREGRPLGACPLRHTEASAEIAGFVAAVTVRQAFENPFDHPIEAVYTFPLPEQGVVHAMRIRTGERTIRGQIKRREEAREIYERARERGQLAALLDEERRNVFTQSIANLMPGARVEFEIEYREVLRYDAGAFEWVFPTVVGPRFSPPGRVPDAERVTPPITPEGVAAGHDVRIRAAIDAGVPILGLESRLHEIDVERPNERTARVSLRKGEVPNRDFVLRWSVAAAELSSGVLVHRDGGQGYASFVLLPPARVTPREVAPKELVFVIDRSGSQSGLPLLKAKETVLWILERLGPDDTFRVVSFSNRTEQLFSAPERASADAKKRARAYLDGIDANGGTYMAEAIEEIAKAPADAHRLRIVAFMTDGYVGNDYEVIDLVRRLRGTSRWFAFGTGNSVNRALLDGIARHGGGEAEYVLLNEPGDAVARKFWERIASPVLTDVSLEFRGFAVDEVFPVAPSDVWAERPLVFHARVPRAGRGSVVVRGYRGGEAWREEIDVEIPERAPGNAALAATWARAKVDELLARDFAALQRGQFPEQIQDQVVEIALAHEILTPFTSFVAVEERVVNEGGQRRTVTVPVEMPQGVRYEEIFDEDESGQAHALRSMSPPAGAAHSIGAAQRRILPSAEAPSGSRDRAPGAYAQDLAKLRPSSAGATLSARARERLDPELLAVALGDADAVRRQVHGGRVQVKVLLDRASAPTLEALHRAGLAIRTRADGWVSGTLDASRLAELAELTGVRYVRPLAG
jgi:Ca-activated chloride channel family protein